MLCYVIAQHYVESYLNFLLFLIKLFFFSDTTVIEVFYSGRHDTVINTAAYDRYV